jgi:hypothetical protein
MHGAKEPGRFFQPIAAYFPKQAGILFVFDFSLAKRKKTKSKGRNKKKKSFHKEDKMVSGIDFMDAEKA